MNYRVFCLDCLLFYTLIERVYSSESKPAASKLETNDDLLMGSSDSQYDDTGWIHFNDMENYDLRKPAKKSDRNKGQQVKKESSSYLHDFDNKRDWKDEMKCSFEAKNYDRLHKIVQSYIQRYVNLFLITSQLQDREVTKDSDIITTDVEIVISAEDLIFLKDYSKNQSTGKTEDDLRLLDAIMGRIIKLKAKTLGERAWNLSQQYTFTIDVSKILKFLNKKEFAYVLALIILVLCFYYEVKYPVILGINIFLSVEAVFLYFKKNEEAQIENHVRILQRGELPVDCTPKDMVWYQSFFSIFKGNQCLDYHKNLIRDAVEEISILECIWETYAYFLAKLPLKLLSTVTRDFAETVTDYFPPPFNYLFYCVFICLFLIFSVFLILPLLGRSIQLSALFGIFSINFGSRHSNRQERVVEIEQQPALPQVRHYQINYVIQQAPQDLINLYNRVLDLKLPVENSAEISDTKTENIETISDESATGKKAIDQVPVNKENETETEKENPKEEKKISDDEKRFKTENSCDCDIHADLEQIKEIVNDLSSSNVD